MTKTQSRIQLAFEQAHAAGRAALIPFVVAGDPALEITAASISELVGAGADILELGIPYSDPLADGPSIVAAAGRALDGGVTFDSALELIRDIPIPVVVFTYANPVVQYGIAALARRLAEVGAAGMIVPDLPLEETIAIAAELAAVGLEMPLLIAPTTRFERAKKIAAASTGFVYLVARLGVTGAESSAERDDESLGAQMQALRSMTALPIAIGFGVSRAEHVAVITRIADGAIVGSALVDAMHKAGPAAAPAAAGDFLRGLKLGANRL